jgi:hypothetical protein
VIESIAGNSAPAIRLPLSITLAVLIACFLCGTSQVAPEGSFADFSLGKIDVGDVAFAAAIALLALTPAFRSHVQALFHRARYFVALVFALILLGLLSELSNAYARRIELSDVFEMCRPAYYLSIVFTIAFCVRTGMLGRLCLSFASGILVAAIANFVTAITMLDDGGNGLFILMNPNVVGNMLAVALLFLSLAFLDGYFLSSFFAICLATALSLVSYSKGAWLMGLLGLACVALAYRQTRLASSWHRSVVVALTWTAIATACVLAVANISTIQEIGRDKLSQSFTDDMYRSDSTVNLRRGQILSSLRISGQNPVLGVGVTNWEAENNRNEYWLNDLFLVNDNPHSGFFYILSGMGFPALCTFAAIMVFPVSLLGASISLTPLRRRAYMTLMAALLVLSGNVMLQILSHYFFWLLCGVAFGLVMRSEVVNRSRIAAATPPSSS